MRFFLAVFSLAFCFPLGAGAHGMEGNLQQQLNGYLVDVGYDAYTLESGKDIVFDFALIINAEKPVWEFAPYDEVQVRVMQKERLVQEKVVSLDAPLAAYTMLQFPADGRYELRVRFLGGGEELAEAVFPLRVGAASLPWQILLYVFVLVLNVAFFAILGASWLSRRKSAS